MNKKERVQRAIAGEPSDRVPISFWGHNFARENSAEELADETVSRLRRFDWDLVKLQSRASSFVEDWGNQYRRSTESAVEPTLLQPAVRSTADLRSLRPLNPLAGVLGEQLAALRLVRQQLGPDVPIIQTLFAPAMVLSYLVGESPKTMLEYVRGYPTETKRALDLIARTYQEYAQASLENGADGIFFAVRSACSEEMTRDEYMFFGLPHDLPVLEAVSGGWLNVLHMHGPHLYFDVVDLLPSQVVNWELEEGNPSLAEGRERAKRAVMGGVSAKPKLREMKPEQVVEQVNAALKETKGERIIVGPGCSIPPDTPEENLFAAAEAVENWRRPQS